MIDNTRFFVPRVYLKTPNAPGQRTFSRCAAPFFLEIRQYSCEKMSCSAQKFLAAGHIGSFQIHPSKAVQKLRLSVSFYKYRKSIWLDFRQQSFSACRFPSKGSTPGHIVQFQVLFSCMPSVKFRFPAPASYTKSDTDRLPRQALFAYRFQSPYARKIRPPADSAR